MTFEQVLQALRSLNVKCSQFVDVFEKAKPNQKLLVAKSFDVQDQEEEKLVQQLVDYLEVPQINGSAMSKVRMEMDELSASGKEIATPEEEEAWNKKLEEAQKIDIAKAEEIKAQRKLGLEGKAPLDAEVPEGEPVAAESNDLTGVKGLGENSVKKLLEANIRTVAEFNALSGEQKVAILGPLVVLNLEKNA